MGEPVAKPYVSYAEYLELEQKSGKKYEWLDGVVYDMEALGMAGGPSDHAGRIAAVGAALGAQLRARRLRVFSSDLKLWICATGLSTYADVSVVADKVEAAPDDKNAAVNPVLLVEVLSDSSEGYDRGEKFAHYRRVPSLLEYVLVSQRSQKIEVFRKNEAGKWVLAEEAGPGETAPLTSIGCELSVDEVYEDPLAKEAPAA